MRARAFSLVELLVVIAIIAVLAAITFPVMVRAKARARQTTCMSNLRQMALRHQIEGARGGDLPCPLSDQYNVGYYDIPNRKLAEDLELADPGSGYYVCYLHGKHVGPGTSPADFDGTIVRLRRDGSVHVRKVDRLCRAGVPVRPDWRLFTDAPCPPEYCPSDLVPCE
jgi:prepilin-type N-terminal cleavage/methylation domain-containing protein